MPTLYQYLGLIFSFYSHDHVPVHIHAKYGNYENKLEFYYANGVVKGVLVKSVPKRQPLPPAILREAKRFALAKEADIVYKWANFYVRHQKPTIERITKRI